MDFRDRVTRMSRILAHHFGRRDLRLCTCVDGNEANGCFSSATALLLPGVVPVFRSFSHFGEHRLDSGIISSQQAAPFGVHSAVASVIVLGREHGTCSSRMLRHFRNQQFGVAVCFEPQLGPAEQKCST